MSKQLMNFEPFRELARFEPMRGFEDFFRDFHLKPALWDGGAQSIRLDVSETDQAYTVKAEIPGMKKEDIKIDVSGNRVTISAETQREEEDKKDGNVIRRERYYGQQYRSFTLAHDVDDTRAEARYDAGVLQLTLPKKPETGARKIAIS